MPTPQPLIQPLRGLRAAPERAHEIAAPPYDVVSSEEARALVEGRPWSFLHISKAEIDLPPGTDPFSPAVYAKAAANLARMQQEGLLLRDAAPGYYVYRLRMPTAQGEHVQTGLVAAASVAAYESGRIKKHEFTRPDKEDDRVRQIEALNAQTGPVLLAWPGDSPEKDAIAPLLQAASEAMPVADVLAPDNIRHTLWRIAEGGPIERINRAFAELSALYIADGHHRSAAAARVAAARRGSAGPAGAAEQFLAVIFPQYEMKILDYNRVVRDLNNLSVENFLTRLAERYTVTPANAPVTPAASGEVGLYLAKRWYKLTIQPQRVPRKDAVARLDVSLLSDQVLGPILGITDLRRDKRIDFVGGMRGLAELEKRVGSGEMAAAFALFPTRMDELIAVADSGQVMPPKSTWFEPKLADGLVSHVLD